MKIYNILILTPLLLMTGCGLIVHGFTQDVKIQTNPPGLSVIAQGKSCLTPCILNVSRKDETIIIVKPNGDDMSLKLGRTLSWWVIPGNIWNLVFIGMFFDTVTGAAWSLDDVNITFPKIEALKDGTKKNESVDKEGIK